MRRRDRSDLVEVFRLDLSERVCMGRWGGRESAFGLEGGSEGIVYILGVMVREQGLHRVGGSMCKNLSGMTLRGLRGDWR